MLASNAEQESMNNLKQIALAMLQYENDCKTFPPAYTTDAKGKRLLSWRVPILPYMEQNNLYRQFHLDEPWDSPHNREAHRPDAGTAESPGSKVASQGKTNYFPCAAKTRSSPARRKSRWRRLPTAPRTRS